MDSLYQKLGLPPYRLDQILPLLDEASSLSSNPKETSTQFYDTAVPIIESMEALAWLVQFRLGHVLPEFAGVERFEMEPCERDILDSIGVKVQQLKNWLFDDFQQAQESYISELGPAKLCQYCKWSFRRLARGPNERPPELSLRIHDGTSHYLLAIDSKPEFQVLEERSMQGCEFCLILREQLDVNEPLLGTFEAERISVWIGFDWDPDEWCLRSVNISLDHSGSYENCLGFDIFTTSDNVAKDLRLLRPPPTSSLDQANLGFIERQLASTEESAVCNTYRPRRLLDVSLGTQSELKLIDGQQAVADPGGLRYATLSYCWGPVEESKKQLKLTTENQNILYDSIRLGLVTPVMRDAIIVCRVLRLRYLWIDSICIRQDGDSTDWEEQSQEMSHIFGNSWLTICAPASKSCLEGFLDHTDRHSRSIEIGYVPKDALQVQGSVLLRPSALTEQHRTPIAYGAGELVPLLRDLESSEWNKRGWVFQEKVLSLRLLYFGARMIHFQHGHHVTSEDGSCSTDGDFFADDVSLLTTFHHSTNLPHQLETIQNQGPFITDFWYSLVPIFSTSNFTDEKDAFPAIAGLARRVHEFTNHRYLAGLWEEDLCCGLLWTPDVGYHDSESRRPPDTLRQALQTIKKRTNSIAPSWSWASRRSRASLMITNKINTTCRIRLHLRAEFEVLESRVLVNGVNPYGRMSGASISLVAPTMRLAAGSVTSMRETNCPPGLLCEPHPDRYVFVHPDWTATTYGIAASIKTKMRGRFRLLLIASCCAGCGDDDNTQVDADSQPDEDNPGPGPEGASHSPRARKLSISTMSTWEQGNEIHSEAMKPEYRTSFYEDSHTGFDPAVDCDLCSDHTLKRDIWGLLIYPAGARDAFYRVGTFFSRAEHGGSAIFQGAEHRRIELV